MPSFAYKVRNTSGSIVEGVIEAAAQQDAINRLRSQKYIVVEIAEAGKNPLVDMIKKLNPFAPKTTAKDLVLFSRQLSTLVSAGVPIVQGLTILGDQIENPAFKTVVVSVREDIESGVAIAEALKKHPDAFEELYVSMIRAGEVGGILDVILERLSNYLEAADKLKGKVKGAMVYPAVVCTVAAGVTFFLVAVVVPKIGETFSSMGGVLPAPTRILLQTSNILIHYFYIFMLLPVALYIAFKFYYKTEKGHVKVDGIVLELPIFGVLLRKVAIAKFTRTLGTLVKSGVPILQALDTVAKTSGNKIVEKAVLSAKESIREGERIAEPLKRSGVFPPMVMQMISVGEETGNLDTMLAKIADFYDQEVDNAVNALTSMIEPLIIVGMGVVIGGIVIAMFLPILSMGEMAGKAG